MSESPWRVAAPGAESEPRVATAVPSRATRVPSRNMKSASGNTSGGEWEPASGEWGGKRRVGAWSGESPFKWEFVRGYGSAVVADFAR